MNTANEHEQDGPDVAAFHDYMLDAFWADYSARCIAWDADFMQRLNAKQGFIAGATAYRLAMGAAMRDGEDSDGMTANVEKLDVQLARMAEELMHDAMAEFGEALDNAAAVANDQRPTHKHDVRFVDGRALRPEQVEELDAIIRATIERFSQDNAGTAQ